MRTAQRGNVMKRAWALVATAVVLAALGAPAAAPAASGDVVLDWYGYAGQELNQAAQMRNQPQRARLEMAMVQGAVYDAVNAIARTNEPYLHCRRPGRGRASTRSS